MGGGGFSGAPCGGGQGDLPCLPACHHLDDQGVGARPPLALQLGACASAPKVVQAQVLLQL